MIAWRERIVWILVLVALAAAAWTFWPRAKPPVGVSRPLPPAVEVREVEKVVVKPKLVYVYRDRVKQDLDLPPAVVDDKAKQVTATGKLDAEDRPYTLTSVLDVETGESEVYARPDPLPWLAPGKRGAVGIAYGMKNGEPAGRLYADHEILRIKALSMGATGNVDQDGDWFAGGFVEWRL